MNNKGFSLVEFLVSIVIVLIAVFVFQTSLVDSFSRSTKTEKNTTARNIFLKTISSIKSEGARMIEPRISNQPSILVRCFGKDGLELKNQSGREIFTPDRLRHDHERSALCPDLTVFEARIEFQRDFLMVKVIDFSQEPYRLSDQMSMPRIQYW